MTQSWQAELRKYNIRVAWQSKKSAIHLLTDHEREIATSAREQSCVRFRSIAHTLLFLIVEMQQRIYPLK
jgi:hypothetical protein